MLSFEAAPVLLGPPDQFIVLSYLIALGLGAYLTQWKLKPRIYRFASMATYLLLIRDQIHVPSDALLIATIPALLVLRGNSLANLLLAVLGLVQMPLVPTNHVASVGVVWATVFAAYWLGSSPTWPIYGLRAGMVAARYFGPYGTTPLLCGAIIATSNTKDPEEALIVIGVWIVSLFLGIWFHPVLAAIALVDIFIQ